MATENVIRVLSEEVVHKIAAGEVVERPASVVKELVENSLDAQATQVGITLSNGGKRLIRVADTGCGMSSQDAILALERHATSKLNSSADLERIATFGFRGEALASIAAVSKMSLVTNTPDSLAGTKVIIEGGRIREVTEVGAPPGTAIEVRNLFYNVPARLKFLKSPAIEQSYIMRLLSQQALTHPGVHLTLRAGGRTLLELPPVTELLPRLATLYGSEVAPELLPLEYRSNGIHLWGFISRPTLHRSTQEHQSTFVNQRLTKNRLISQAVYEGYRELLPKGRHPIWALFLEVPYEAVDVNVHPAKLEVRFGEPREIRQSILSAIQQTLTQALAATQVFPTPIISSPTTPKTKTEAQATPSGSAPSYEPGEHVPGIGDSRPDPPYRERIKGAVEAYFEKTTPLATPSASTRQPAARVPATRETPARVPKPIRSEDPSGSLADQEFFASLEPVGQIDSSFIICQNATELVIIDQHAAHERIRYEVLRQHHNAPPPQRDSSQGHRPEGHRPQRLLFPIILEPSFKEAALLEENLGVFFGLGFEIAPLGGRTFALQAAPGDLEPGRLGQIIQDMLDGLEKQGSLSSAELRDELLKQLACHSAIKANQRLEPEEIRQLLRELAGLHCPPCCPHGRPFLLRYRLTELRRHFLRKTSPGKPKSLLGL